jgi:hypothetical protein
MLLAACSSTGAKVVLPDDMTGSDTASSDDTATDTDTGTSTDTATNSVAGTYTGDVDGTLTSREGGGGGGGGGGGMPPELDCSGSVSVEVAEDGGCSGEADCTDRNGMSFEGLVEGTVRDGRASATWSIRMGRSNVDLALDGTLANGGLELSGIASDDRFELSVGLSATR